MNFVFERARKIVQGYGYSPIFTSLIEKRELFERPLGLSSDIVNKEMIEIAESSSFVDAVLRPEGTTSVLRAYLDKYNDSKEQQRYYYFGPMFRNERAQKGRYKQFYQFGIENLHCEPILGDYEVILLADMIMKDIFPNNQLDYQVRWRG